MSPGDNDHLAAEFMRNLCKTAVVINNIRAAASAQSLPSPDVLLDKHSNNITLHPAEPASGVLFV